MNIIISDEWLSRIVGKPVYELKSFEINLKLNDLPKGQVLIWSKIPVDNIDKLICLQKLGFYIVDTNIKFILSDKISLNAAETFSFDAPPPTSKKFAGSSP